jgi:hypothetical protein
VVAVSFGKSAVEVVMTCVTPVHGCRSRVSGTGT